MKNYTYSIDNIRHIQSTEDICDGRLFRHSVLTEVMLDGADVGAGGESESLGEGCHVTRHVHPLVTERQTKELKWYVECVNTGKVCVKAVMLHVTFIHWSLNDRLRNWKDNKVQLFHISLWPLR